MTTQEFIEFATREEARLKWYGEAREFALTLLAQQKALDAATKDRDKALADRDKALADIEARKKRDATAADKERVALAAELKVLRDTADAEVRRKGDQLVSITKDLDRMLILKTEAEMQHDAEMKRLRSEALDAQARVTALLADERAIKERLTAALGR